jgi:hypothetical protein
MTPAQAAWLRKLRDEGDPRVVFSSEAWTSLHNGWIRKDVHGVFSVTPAGLAALAEYEERMK